MENKKTRYIRERQVETFTLPSPPPEADRLEGRRAR